MGMYTPKDIEMLDGIRSEIEQNVNNWEYFQLVEDSEQEYILQSLFTLYIEVRNDLITMNESSIIMKSFFDAIKNFSFYPLESYNRLFYRAVEKYINTKQRDGRIKNLFILSGGSATTRINKETGQSKLKRNEEIKSHHLMMYLFKCNVWGRIQDKYCCNKKITINLINSKEEVTSEQINLMKKKETKVLIVDDFIGSGESAKKALNNWREFLRSEFSQNDIESVDVDTLVSDFLCLVCEKETVKNFYEDGNTVYCAKIVDSFLDDVNQELLDFTKKKKGVIGDNDFNDYLLLSMARTPNNTARLFTFSAPFKRIT